MSTHVSVGLCSLGSSSVEKKDETNKVHVIFSDYSDVLDELYICMTFH